MPHRRYLIYSVSVTANNHLYRSLAMGTRSLTCVYYRGAFVVAQFCRLDGYPAVQGPIILKFLRKPGNVERLKRD
jgi:hypothetical protein